MRRFVGMLTVAAAATLALTGCSGDGGGNNASGSSGPVDIKVGYPSDTASYGDLYVCQDEGIFAKHGLNVELTLLQTSAQLLGAMASDSVQVAGGDGSAIAAGALQDQDLKMVELKLPVYFTEMWGKPNIKSIGDLKGKTVAVTAAGSVTDNATRIMLADKGLTKDVNVTNFASLSAAMAAAKNGSVDAIVTAPPQAASMRNSGWAKVTDMTNYKTAASVYAVSGKYASEHADVVQKFVDADVECLNYLKDSANRTKSVDAIAKHTQTDDKELAGYAYDFFTKIWSDKPVVDTGIVQSTFETAAQGKKAPSVSKFIDNSFVNKTLGNGK
jgi:NitT/TauT family transport system substrate-binding protein